MTVVKKTVDVVNISGLTQEIMLGRSLTQPAVGVPSIPLINKKKKCGWGASHQFPQKVLLDLALANSRQPGV